MKALRRGIADGVGNNRNTPRSRQVKFKTGWGCVNERAKDPLLVFRRSFLDYPLLGQALAVPFTNSLYELRNFRASVTITKIKCFEFDTRNHRWP